MFSQDDDNNERVALGIVFAAVALAITVAAGAAMYSKHHFGKGKTTAVAATMPQASESTAPVPVEAASQAANAVAAPAGDAASIAVEAGVVKFYFASGKSDLAQGGAQALADIAAGVQAGKKAIVSGYVDSTGSAAQNKEIAKKRAFAVRDLLLSIGVPADKIELQKPSDIQAGTGAAARRVEVTLL